MSHTPLHKKSKYTATALSNTIHPISSAISLLKSNKFTNGRVKPLLVVGMEGLNPFIHEKDVGNCITDDQVERYKKYMHALELSNDNEPIQKKQKIASNILNTNHEKDGIKIVEKDVLIMEDKLNDTVGAIIIDSNGYKISGVSSGGNH